MILKLLTITTLLFSLIACQVVGPIFVDYNGVRRDVAEWINTQTLMSMQQKRSLAQLSRAQQRLVRIDTLNNEKKLEISRQNSIAMHCAQQVLTPYKIELLQLKVFGHEQEKKRVLEKYNQEFPKVKLDLSKIQCD